MLRYSMPPTSAPLSTSVSISVPISGIRLMSSVFSARSSDISVMSSDIGVMSSVISVMRSVISVRSADTARSVMRCFRCLCRRDNDARYGVGRPREDAVDVP